MYNHDIVRPTTDLINLTEHTIFLYEGFSGNICAFQPVSTKLPDTPANDEPNIHYVVDQKSFDTIKHNRESFADIAVITGEHYGRNGIRIAYLTWAENPKIKICLYSKSYLQNLCI